MKHCFLSYSLAIAIALFAAPLAAWADHNPDFDDDAKPILRMQPGLLQFVEATFQVRDTGLAKVPGDDDRHAMPPYIFLAKPRGYPGDYYITLLIQPGPPGHILKVVDPTRPHGGAPQQYHPTQQPVYNGPPPNYQGPPPNYQSAPPNYQGPPPQQAQAPSMPYSPAQAPSNQPASQPLTPPITSETPSGPITSNPGSQPAPSNSPGLAPPPDVPPAPVNH